MDESILKQDVASAGTEPLGPASLSSLVLSLTVGALQQMGQGPTGKEAALPVNPEFAKHAIDLIELLREKTKGNTTGEEDELFNAVLLELRVRYMKVLDEKQDVKPASAETPAEKPEATTAG